MNDSRIGRFDPELWARYRASKDGTEKRQLLDRLVIENTPLIKVLVDQLCGRGEAKRNAVRLGGCHGFRDLEWEDCMQAGRRAFVKAMGRFNPKKGKLPFYLLNKIRYELQCIRDREGLVRRDRDDDNGPSVGLIGEQEVLDALGGSVEPAELADEWEGSEDLGGALVVSLPEGFAHPLAENDLVPRPAPRPLVQAFLEDELQFHRAGRVAKAPLLACWERAALARAERPDPEPLLEALLAGGARVSRVRVAWSPYPVVGFQGVRLQTAARKTQRNGAAA